MLRDYSDAALEKLKNQIFDINAQEFSQLTDMVGDAWYYIKSFIGRLDIEDYLNDVSSYHKQVLDQHNTTIQELEEIFEDVRALDLTYEGEIWSVKDSLQTGAEQLLNLAEMIDPATKSFSLSAVQALGVEARKDIGEAAEALQDAFHDAVVKLQKAEAKKAGLGALKDAASIVASVVSFMASVYSGDFVKAALDVYKVLDKFVAFAEDFSSFVINGLGMIATLFPGTERGALEVYEQCSEMSSIDGISDYFKDMPKIHQVMLKVDSLVSALSIFFAAKGIVENAGDLASGEKDLIDIFVDNTGLKYDTGKPFAGEKATWSNIKLVIGLLVAIINEDLGNEIIGNTELGGMIKAEKGIFDNWETEQEFCEENPDAIMCGT